MVEVGEVGQHGGGISAGVVLGAQFVQRRRDVALHQMLEQVDDAGAIRQPQHVADGVGRDLAGRMGDRLVEDRLGVAHRTVRGARDHGKCIVFGLDALDGADAGEVGLDQRRVDAPQVETLAARQDRDGNLADLGGGKDELHMRRRFLERLQQAVEGLVGQHVDLVDDVDLVARGNRRIADAVDNVANIVDAGVRGRVHLDDVDMAAFHDRFAVLAETVHRDRRPVDLVGLVVERSRQDARGGGLAHAAHAGQHPRLGDPPGRKGIGEGADHRLLADEARKVPRPVLAGENPVAGRSFSGILPGFVHRPDASDCWSPLPRGRTGREFGPRRLAASMATAGFRIRWGEGGRLAR